MRVINAIPLGSSLRLPVAIVISVQNTEGQWKDNQRHGLGSYTEGTNQKVQQCAWVAGRPIKPEQPLVRATAVAQKVEHMTHAWGVKVSACSKVALHASERAADAEHEAELARAQSARARHLSRRMKWLARCSFSNMILRTTILLLPLSPQQSPLHAGPS
jgi:hypothetical protein